MYGKLVIDGNAVYEIDEACLLRKRDEKMGGQNGCQGMGCPLKSLRKQFTNRANGDKMDGLRKGG